MALLKQKSIGIPPMLSVIAMGAGISLLITLIGAVIGAILLSGETIGTEQVGLISTIITVISAGIGSLIASGRFGKMKMQVCLITGAVYYLLLLVLTILLFGGLFSGMGRGALAVFGGSAGVAFLSLMNKKKPKFKVKKNGYR